MRCITGTLCHSIPKKWLKHEMVLFFRRLLELGRILCTANNQNTTINLVGNVFYSDFVHGSILRLKYKAFIHVMFM